MVSVNQVTVTDYITKSKLPAADYVINPYVGCPHQCIYCYAEFMKRFTRHDEKWGDFLDVKSCHKPINTKKIAGTSVLIGSVTDAYNPFENRYLVTRNILEQLVNTSAHIEILTKSSLVTRDIDLFRKIPNIRIGISMNSFDETFRKQTEPRASSVPRRVEALKILHDAGIQTYVFMSPIFPGITDFQMIIGETKSYTDAFYFENLNLRSGYYLRVMQYIESNYPQFINLYNEIFRQKKVSYWEELEESITRYCTKRGLNFKSYFYHERIKKR